MAVAAFKSQREGLLSHIRHCLPSLTNTLYAQSLIPQDLHEEVNDRSIGKGERSVTLLDCVQARLEAVPSDFVKIVRVLESDHYLEPLANQLVHSYCESIASCIEGGSGHPPNMDVLHDLNYFRSDHRCVWTCHDLSISALVGEVPYKYVVT